MNREISELLHLSAGALSRRRYPELATQFDHLVRQGELVAAVPGVYVHRDLAGDWRTLITAVSEWDRRAVIVGEAAAASTFWPELTPRTVTVAGRRSSFRRPGITFGRRVVPPELVVEIGGVRMACPALTAIDLVPQHGGDAIDRALRSRMATLAGMHRALELTPSRHANADRRLILLDSRNEPWSGAERVTHRLFRNAGITGWRTNVPILCDGFKFFQDVAFDHNPVVVEIDGRIHLRPDIFETDRRRGNYLLLAGKRVLHFTWLMVDNEPDWVVSTTERAVAIFRP